MFLTDPGGRRPSASSFPLPLPLPLPLSLPLDLPLPLDSGRPPTSAAIEAGFGQSKVPNIGLTQTLRPRLSGRLSKRLRRPTAGSSSWRRRWSRRQWEDCYCSSELEAERELLAACGVGTEGGVGSACAAFAAFVRCCCCCCCCCVEALFAFFCCLCVCTTCLSLSEQAAFDHQQRYRNCPMCRFS